jgi:glycosyltransferase involved in cell wall biosynthesis
LANKIKVAFCGGEGQNWALDHDLEHARRITRSFAEEVEPRDADLIHSVWWRGILHLQERDLVGQPVIASIADDPKTMMSAPEYLLVRNHITAWLSEYSESLDFMTRNREACFLYPDPIELDVFRPAPDMNAERRKLKGELGIPEDAYLIGNFHRDSSMTDLLLPKKQKGADLLLEIASGLVEAGEKIHFLLAGPRRHFLRRHFDDRGIPYTFFGEAVDGDDVTTNTLELEEIARLIRGLDLYLITSRWEGAPNTLLEASASTTPVLSTPVGQAEDILSPKQIYRSVSAGIGLIREDIRDSFLAETVVPARVHLEKWNSDEALANRLRHIYEMTLRLKQPAENKTRRFWAKSPAKNVGDAPRLLKKKRGTLSFGIETNAGPGDANHAFWESLVECLNEVGCPAGINTTGTDVCLVDDDGLETASWKPPRGCLVQHWIGSAPGKGPERLKQSEDLNRRFADVTIFASGYGARVARESGFQFRDPVLIRRGVNRQYITNRSDGEAHLSEPIRLVSRVDGIPIATWQRHVRGLLPALGEKDVSWVLAGAAPSDLPDSGLLSSAPVDTPGAWADLLGERHIYLELDEGNAVGDHAAHALAIGLPVLYGPEGGALPELAQFGGVSYSSNENFAAALDQLWKHYAHYRRLIWIPDMKEIAGQTIEAAYTALARK